jgi:hypothetical protein
MAKTIPIKKICPSCKEEFDVCPPGQTSRFYPDYEQVFCSRKCSGEARYRSGSQCNVLVPTISAYIAGFIDADGSIFMYKSRNKISIRVAFTNNNIFVMQWILDQIGVGSIVVWEPSNRKHTTRYQIQINSDAALTLLKQIEPYLIRKKRQALIAITHQELLPIPEYNLDIEKQRASYDLMQQLNKRGS